MQEILTIQYVSRAHHCSQVITGLKMYCDNFSIPYIIEDHCGDYAYPYKGTYVVVKYKRCTLVYDMSDGYQDLEGMIWYLNLCDFYFKRSYSKEYNKKILNGQEKIFPYGFNYFITYKRNPLDGSYCKEILKRCLRLNHNTIYTTSAFEETPKYNENPQILFSVRLWPKDESLSIELNNERDKINRMRINVVRTLKERYGQKFVGGLYNTPLARELAPDLIIPDTMTAKDRYLSLLHNSDICISTMGLHESIGGKTGEYVAAAKAIVSESLRYDVIGDFQEGKNYLRFSNEIECLKQVESLVNNPDILYRMKVENAIYYQKYLRPDMLAYHSLKTAGLL